MRNASVGLKGGGFLGLVAVIELAVAAVVLQLGAGGWLHVALVVAWLVFSASLMRLYFQARLRWTGLRLTMTDDLVERMVGHRTRLAQAPAEHWHESEDQSQSHPRQRGSEVAGLQRICGRVLGAINRAAPPVRPRRRRSTEQT